MDLRLRSIAEPHYGLEPGTESYYEPMKFDLSSLSGDMISYGLLYSSLLTLVFFCKAENKPFQLNCKL